MGVGSTPVELTFRQDDFVADFMAEVGTALHSETFAPGATSSHFTIQVLGANDCAGPDSAWPPVRSADEKSITSFS